MYYDSRSMQPVLYRITRSIVTGSLLKGVTLVGEPYAFPPSDYLVPVLISSGGTSYNELVIVQRDALWLVSRGWRSRIAQSALDAIRRTPWLLKLCPMEQRKPGEVKYINAVDKTGSARPLTIRYDDEGSEYYDDSWAEECLVIAAAA